MLRLGQERRERIKAREHVPAWLQTAPPAFPALTASQEGTEGFFPPSQSGLCSAFPASCSSDLEEQKERGKKSVYERHHHRVLAAHVQQCYCHGTREEIQGGSLTFPGG